MKIHNEKSSQVSPDLFELDLETIAPFSFLPLAKSKQAGPAPKQTWRDSQKILSESSMVNETN